MFGILIHPQSDGDVTRAERVARVEAKDGTTWLAWPGGSVSQPAKSQRRSRRAAASNAVAAGDGEVAAPCAGSVTKQDVVDGAAVQAGDRLGVLEAMKMEFALIAPIEGIVRWHVEGDGRVVQKGVTLAVVLAPK